MKNKKVVMIILFLFIMILIINIILWRQSSSGNTLLVGDLQSMCYTNIQPSSEITKSGLPSLTINSLTNEIKLGFNEEISNLDIKQIQNTGSMRPTISDESFVIVKQPTREDLYIGDIIVFNCNNNQVMHRIINITASHYLTKGDNNHINDLQGFGCSPKFEDIKFKVIGVLY